MITDLNKEIETIEYNYLNLPMKVDFGNGNYLLYIYDAAGIKLAQEVYENNTLMKRTDYIEEFIYEDDVLQFIQHEEGRIVEAEGGGWEYQYHLKDHLACPTRERRGNTRVTFTAEPKTRQFDATMEMSFATEEEALFDNLDTRHNDNALDHTDGGSTVFILPHREPALPLWDRRSHFQLWQEMNWIFLCLLNLKMRRVSVPRQQPDLPVN